MPVLDELFSGDDERAALAAPQVTSDCLPALRAALTAADPDTRWWAVAALAYLPDEQATELLLPAAHDPDPNLRAAAIHALGQRADPAAAHALLQALEDPSDYLTRLASDALIHLARPGVPGLIQALEHHPQPRVRASAARTLAVIADPAAIPALFEALGDESVLVRHWAEEGLERLGIGQVYFTP